MLHVGPHTGLHVTVNVYLAFCHCHSVTLAAQQPPGCVRVKKEQCTGKRSISMCSAAYFTVACIKRGNSASNILVLWCSVQRGSIGILFFPWLTLISDISHMGRMCLNLWVSVPGGHTAIRTRHNCQTHLCLSMIAAVPLTQREDTISSSSTMDSLYDGWMLMHKDLEWLTLNPDDEY